MPMAMKMTTVITLISETTKFALAKPFTEKWLSRSDDQEQTAPRITWVSRKTGQLR